MKKARTWNATGVVDLVGVDGRDIYVHMRAEFHHDPKHGADRDGNRGIPQDFLDDVSILFAEDDEANSVDLTGPQRDEAVDLANEEAWSWEVEDREER